MFRLIKEFPLQVGLFLFNTGIFAWLQTTSSAILAQLNLKEPLSQYIPEPILALTGDSVAAIQAYVGNAGWAWLIFSMIVLVIIHFINGVLKFLFVAALIAIGLYLLFQNQEMIRSLMGAWGR